MTFFFRFAAYCKALKENVKRVVGDIRFWIILFFIIRLYGITNPPLEIAHSWRQSLTNMIARNFLEEDPNILYPRIDMRGAGAGIIGSEFPLFNYIIFMFSKLFGVQHWYGRLINLFVSSFGIFFFHQLLKRFFGSRIALLSSLILLCSMWFSYSRKTMPDTFSVSLVIIGIYYAMQYLYENGFLYLFLFFVFTSLGALCKIPAMYLVGVFAVVFADPSVPRSRKVYLSGMLIAIFSLVTAWYFYWVPHLVSAYNYPLYFPRSLAEGFKELTVLWKETAEKFYFSSLRSYTAFLFFLGGIFFILKNRDIRLGIIVLILLVLFSGFMMKAGEVFSLHGYYIIPFTPVMALCAGYALAQIKNTRWIVMAMFLIAVESVANQFYDFRIKGSETYKLNLEGIADKVSDKGTLIGINGGDNPQQIYLTHRKGWTFSDERLQEEQFLDSLSEKGCKFIFINKVTLTNSADITGATVFEDNSFKVIRLKK